MKQIEIPSFTVTKTEVWFLDTEDTLDDISSDIIDVKDSRQVSECLVPFKNGVILLGPDENDIFGRFDKKFRYEVARAEREGIQSSRMNASDELNTICLKLQAFSALKGISYIHPKMLSAYASEGVLVVTSAQHESNTLQYHLYFCGSDEAILLASFPNVQPEYDSKFFGWANRLLHWRDMQMFKQSGVIRYNLGGMGNPVTESNKNIVNFKMEMNPDTVTYYHGTVAGSLKGKAYLGIKNLLRSPR